MITFKTLKWRNFLSTGNQFIEMNLQKAPSTLIIGANGSGKSTMLDALCFVLFNRPFRTIKKEQLVNTINNTDCEIQVTFNTGNKEYKVIRGIKPNIFEIYCNDVLINQDASNIDYQNTLEQQILKCNYRAFCQVVILGSSSYEPFMHLRARYRREVVEEILDIRVFSHMDLLLRHKQGELSKAVTDVRHKFDLMTEKYELQKNHFEQIQKRDNTDITDKREQLEQNETYNKQYSQQLQNLNEKIITTKVELEDKPRHDQKANQLAKLEAKIETNLLNHKKTLEFFEKNETCPTCTQQIDKSFKDQKCQHEKNTISKLESGLKELLNEIIKTETQVNEMNAVSQKISDINLEVAKIQTSLESIDKHTKVIHEEMQILSNQNGSLDKIKEELRNLQEQLRISKVELDKVQEEKNYVDILREILNDKGAKARIIKKYLPIMNALINKYLQSMDFFINFNLDEEFNETIKSRYRDEFVYNNFSEGEKMRIDLALLFTWRDIARMKNSTNTNLLLLDEIFDSSLDGQGTDDFFKILKALPNENVFIISHKGDIMFDKFTHIVKYEKDQNFTRLVNA